MIVNLSLHPDMYHLYLDLNKAFNSVPHRALWQIVTAAVTALNYTLM